MGYIRLFIPAILLFSIILIGCNSQSTEYYEHTFTLGQEGSGIGEFREPIGIAIDSEGFIYVSDAGNNRIQKFNSEGIFVKTWGKKGKGSGELNRPMHMSISPGGYLYVAEYLNDRIQVFNKQGQFIRFIGLKENNSSYFDAPSGVTVDTKGIIYAADFYHHTIQIFDADGKFLHSIGKHGKILRRKFNYPTDVEIGSDGSLYVADAYNNRIQKFTPEGNFISIWGGILGLGIPARRKGYFNVATGIALDAKDNLYVTDFYNNRIQKINANNKLVTIFGSSILKYPTDAALDKKGNIWVVDFGNNRIVKFKPKEVIGNN